MSSKQDYQRLGDHIRAARLAAGHRNREAFADTIDITSRTLADIENGELGKRKSFSADTMAVIEREVGWSPGTWRKVLADSDYQPTQTPPLPGLFTTDAAQVSDDRLIVDRPDDVPPRVWESIVASALSHMGWEITNHVSAEAGQDFMLRTREGRTVVFELKGSTAPAPKDDRWPSAIAARRGQSEGRQQRRDQDDAGEAPDHEGPEGGA